MTNTINLRPAIENILIKINSRSRILIDYREFYYKKPFGSYFVIYRNDLNTKLKKEFTLEKVLKFLENFYSDLNRDLGFISKKNNRGKTDD